MSAPLLQVDNLSVGFQQPDGSILTRVNAINFKLQAGKTLALVGESGSGKTLTALSINQLLPPGAAIHQDSRIVWQGQQDLLTLPRDKLQHTRGRQIGMVFQDAMVAMNPVLTVGAQMHEVVKRHQPLKNQDYCLQLLDEVGLPSRCYHSYPHELSGGMVQRAHIATAIAAAPKLLIADEPTTALDPSLQTQIIELLKSLQQNHQMGILFITHDLRLVEQCADQVMVMQSGELVEARPAKSFFKFPKHAYSQALIKAATPKPRPELKKAKPSRATPWVSLDNVNVQFKLKNPAAGGQRTVNALNDVNLAIYPGKTLAIIGESGSGKTTTARVLLDLVQPNSGQLVFADAALNGSDRTTRKRRRQAIQAVFQNPYSAMNPRMTIAQILTEGLWAQKRIKTQAEARKHAAKLLAQVELDNDCLQRFPHAFSGGQRQRICIARALAMQPELLICDEPTSALDVSIQAQILQLLKQLQRQHNIAMLLITHDIAVVNQLADQVLSMNNGQLQPYT